MDLQSGEGRVLLEEQLRKLLQLITVQPPVAEKTYDQLLSSVCPCTCVSLRRPGMIFGKLAVDSARLGSAVGYCASVRSERHINIPTPSSGGIKTCSRRQRSKLSRHSSITALRGAESNPRYPHTDFSQGS